MSACRQLLLNQRTSPERSGLGNKGWGHVNPGRPASALLYLRYIERDGDLVRILFATRTVTAALRPLLSQGLLEELTCVAAPRLLDEAAPALLVCFGLAAGFAGEFVDRDT
jgi:hypothetical protein